ncbi:hypothetical protein C8R46DRAFT_1038857 [Mycena filopes]|nr:hypothetical protein C8R46DRAFT_1038857 [Mycena filopes]
MRRRTREKRKTYRVAVGQGPIATILKRRGRGGDGDGDGGDEGGGVGAVAGVDGRVTDTGGTSDDGAGILDLLDGLDVFHYHVAVVHQVVAVRLAQAHGVDAAAELLLLDRIHPSGLKAKPVEPLDERIEVAGVVSGRLEAEVVEALEDEVHLAGLVEPLERRGQLGDPSEELAGRAGMATVSLAEGGVRNAGGGGGGGPGDVTVLVALVVAPSVDPVVKFEAIRLLQRQAGDPEGDAVNGGGGVGASTVKDATTRAREPGGVFDVLRSAYDEPKYTSMESNWAYKGKNHTKFTLGQPDSGLSINSQGAPPEVARHPPASPLAK